MAIGLRRKCLNSGGMPYYWDDYRNECDFVLKTGAKVVSAIQVCHEMTVDNLDREKKGLLKAMDHFNLQEGTIVTFAQSGEEEIDGKMIRMVPFYRWAWE